MDRAREGCHRLLSSAVGIILMRLIRGDEVVVIITTVMVMIPTIMMIEVIMMTKLILSFDLD